jgi:hypothetical protein
MGLLFAGESRRLATLILAAKRPLMAESSHSPGDTLSGR